MESMQFGRKKFSLDRGTAFLTSMSITEKPILGEDEQAFTERLQSKYKDRQGTLELVFKKGDPIYAIITLF